MCFFVLHTATRVLKDWECQVVSPRLGLDIGIYIHSTLLVSIPVLKPLQFQWFLLSLHPFVCLPTSTHHAPSNTKQPGRQALMCGLHRVSLTRPYIVKPSQFILSYRISYFSTGIPQLRKWCRPKVDDILCDSSQWFYWWLMGCHSNILEIHGARRWSCARGSWGPCATAFPYSIPRPVRHGQDYCRPPFGNRGVLVLFDVGYPGNCCIQHGKQFDTQVDGYPSRQGPVVAVQPPLRTSFRMPMACAWPRTMWKVQILKVQYLMVPILCHKETQWKPKGI